MRSVSNRINRTLSLALALTGLSGVAQSAFAQSSVQLYGIVDSFVGAQKLPGGERAWQVGGGGMSTSFFGFGGTEDLGGGYKTVFALESFFRPQNGKAGSFDGDTFFSRNAYVGIQAPYGTLTLGRQSTLLYLAGTLFNPFYASFTFSPIVNHMYEGLGTYPSFKTDQGIIGGTAWSNAVQYATPDYRGLSARVLYSFGNQAGDNSKKKVSAQMMYQQGPLAVSGVYQYASYNSSADDLASLLPGFKSQSVGQLAASYNFNFVKLYGEYMYTSNQRTPATFHVDTVQAGFAIPVGVARILGSWAWSRDHGGLDQTRQTWALSYDYPLSKHTDLYAAYMSDHLSRLSSGNTMGIGVRARF